jgi:hypothetical protein
MGFAALNPSYSYYSYSWSVGWVERSETHRLLLRTGVCRPGPRSALLRKSPPDTRAQCLALFDQLDRRARSAMDRRFLLILL